MKQGSPESGLLYCLTVAKTFRKLTDKWSSQGYGFQLQRGGRRHQYAAFADDTVVLGKTTIETKAIYDDIVQDLQQIGLGVNGEKTQFISNHSPQRCKILPGQNQTGTGMTILGRHLDISETTSQDLARKEASAWAHFRRTRQILQHKTGLGHRLRILQSCVLQRILWGCESWVLTKKRLQHLRGVHTKMLRSMIACPGHLQGLEPGTRILEHTRHVRQLLQTHKFLLLDELAGRKFWNWSGHVARLKSDHIAHDWIRFRDMAWWRKQQADPQGWRHIHSDAAIARWEGPLIRYSAWKENWKSQALDRERWNKAFADFWVRLNTIHPRRSPQPRQSPRQAGSLPQILDQSVPHRPPPARRENRLENGNRSLGGNTLGSHSLDTEDAPGARPRSDSRGKRDSHPNIDGTASAALSRSVGSQVRGETKSGDSAPKPHTRTRTSRQKPGERERSKPNSRKNSPRFKANKAVLEGISDDQPLVSLLQAIDTDDGASRQRLRRFADGFGILGSGISTARRRMAPRDGFGASTAEASTTSSGSTQQPQQEQAASTQHQREQQASKSCLEAIGVSSAATPAASAAANSQLTATSASARRGQGTAMHRQGKGHR